MKRKGPDKYLGKRQYEIHIKHLSESSDKAKLYVQQSDIYLQPEYNCHAMDESYLKKCHSNEVITLKSNEYNEFVCKLSKNHWFLSENFVLGSNFLRFDRFILLKCGKKTGWSIEKLPDQATFLQFVRFFDRTNCLDIFKFDVLEDLIQPSDNNIFTQK